MEKMIAEAEEIITVGKKLNIKAELLADDEAESFIQRTLDLFTPFRTTGHLGIGHDYITLPIDKWEFSYMEYLSQESGYIFFSQNNRLSGRTVVKIENLQELGKILDESFGMEYFLTNKNADFLIAVNWYVVEISGIELSAFWD